MTLINEIDLDILKIYMYTKNDVTRSGLSKVKARTGQTDRQTRPNALAAAFSGVNKVDELSCMDERCVCVHYVCCFFTCSSHMFRT